MSEIEHTQKRQNPGQPQNFKMNVLRGTGRHVHFEGGFLTFLGLDKGVARFGARICSPLEDSAAWEFLCVF